MLVFFIHCEFTGWTQYLLLLRLFSLCFSRNNTRSLPLISIVHVHLSQISAWATWVWSLAVVGRQSYSVWCKRGVGSIEYPKLKPSFENKCISFNIAVSLLAKTENEKSRFNSGPAYLRCELGTSRTGEQKMAKLVHCDKPEITYSASGFRFCEAYCHTRGGNSSQKKIKSYYTPWRNRRSIPNIRTSFVSTEYSLQPSYRPITI